MIYKCKCGRNTTMGFFCAFCASDTSILDLNEKAEPEEEYSELGLQTEDEER